MAIVQNFPFVRAFSMRLLTARPGAHTSGPIFTIRWRGWLYTHPHPHTHPVTRRPADEERRLREHYKRQNHSYVTFCSIRATNTLFFLIIVVLIILCCIKLSFYMKRLQRHGVAEYSTFEPSIRCERCFRDGGVSDGGGCNGLRWASRCVAVGWS